MKKERMITLMVVVFEVNPTALPSESKAGALSKSKALR